MRKHRVRETVSLLLPKQADNTIRGSRVPAVVFGVLTVVSIVRSCIHLLAPDGGAGSIAGMDLAVAGADGIVFAFALWGSAQLVYALLQLLVVIRYRSLVPLMYVVLLLETGLRWFVGATKPVTFAHTPPGALGNWMWLVLSVAMLGVTFRTAGRASEAPPAAGSSRVSRRKRGVAAISDVGAEALDAVLAFLPVFAQPGVVFGKWHTPEGQHPYYAESTDVRAFVSTLHQHHITFPFDWPSWQQEEANRYVDRPETMAQADLLTLRKLLTVHIRADRFVEGHLAHMLENGHVISILRRLQAIREEMA